MNTSTQQNNGMAIASLVLGIISIVFVFIFQPIGALSGIVGIVLAVKGKKEIAITQEAGAGMATAGLVCSIIGIVLNGIFLLCALAIVGTIGAAGCAAANSGLF